MALMALGPHVFEVVGLNFQRLESASEAIWAEFGRWGQSDGAHYVGRRRVTQTISGVLYDALGGIEAYNAIRLTQGLGMAMPMIRLGAGFLGSVLGMVTVERVGDTAEYFDAGGRAQKISFDIDVKSLEGAGIF